MGSNDNNYDDGAAPLRATEEEYMTNGNDMLVFEQDNHEELVNEYAAKYAAEYDEYFKASWDEGYRCDTETDEDGVQYADDYELREEFAEEKPEQWARFVEESFHNWGAN